MMQISEAEVVGSGAEQKWIIVDGGRKSSQNFRFFLPTSKMNDLLYHISAYFSYFTLAPYFQNSDLMVKIWESSW